MCGYKNSRFFKPTSRNLSTESVKSTSLSFQGIDDVHGGDSLSLGVLSVCYCITNNVFQENFQDTTSFFVDKSTDTFDTTSTSKTTNSWFSDTFNVFSSSSFLGSFDSDVRGNVFTFT